MARTIQIAVIVSPTIAATGSPVARAGSKAYQSGSLIIPMDTTYQDAVYVL